jgi:hypothetical protein
VTIWALGWRSEAAAKENRSSVHALRECLCAGLDNAKGISASLGCGGPHGKASAATAMKSIPTVAAFNVSMASALHPKRVVSKKEPSINTKANNLKSV